MENQDQGESDADWFHGADRDLKSETVTTRGPWESSVVWADRGLWNSTLGYVPLAEPARKPGHQPFGLQVSLHLKDTLVTLSGGLDPPRAMPSGVRGVFAINDT